MKSAPRLKTALLAAVSLTAASVAVAHAADRPAMEPVAIEHALEAADSAHDRAGSIVTAQKIGIIAAAAASLAGLARLVGFRRIKAAAALTAKAAGRAVSAGAAATAGVANAALRAVASPFRFAMLMAGLALIAFTGIGFYDVEWAAGLIFGALFAATMMLGAGKLWKSLATAPVRARR